jgi:hypothetical protein
MKKSIILMSAFIIGAASLPAQITQEQADVIVTEYVKSNIAEPYLLYAHLETPSAEGLAIATFQEEIVNVKYACWAYYLDENPELSEPSQHRYLFVKEDDGNLLEIITANDLGPEELSQWKLVEPVGIDDVENVVLIVYPNPTENQLRIINYELGIEKIKLFDIFGRQVYETTETIFDISHLPTGVYFVQIKTETGIITQKVIKQ